MNTELIDQYLEAVCPKCQSVIKKKIYAVIGCQTCGHTEKVAPATLANKANSYRYANSAPCTSKLPVYEQSMA
ncbi:hypothetical protein [Spartinivicinus poritis]|uniref:Uncharacterized protein n=1 Tax=Spartinivicinus poritis TaxID=2994640 RepID=A0ABT5U6M6_9GAMM|nr:hypothetical protein [Spartinivicinus sp. A2-2]MDE1460829.1 hypothetical protein [Spartinivicinus sp. A2-2]